MARAVGSAYGAPAVVLDAGYGGLGAARSLGRLGILVYATAARPDAPALASRYWAGVYLWDFARASPRHSVDFLLALGRDLGRRAVLFPTSDTSALLVADHAEVLEERFQVSLPPARLVRALIDKRHLDRLAREHGIPTAQSLFPSSWDDIEDFLAAVSLPVIAKGIDPCTPGGTRKVICRSRAEARSFYQNLSSGERTNLMLQEFIPGADGTAWMVDGYFDNRGRCLAVYAGRKVRQSPADAGVASLGVCQRNPELEAMTVRFLHGVGYRGPVDVDYRFDARDGRYKLLDVNPRLGAAFRLFVDEGGLDIARIAYLDAVGQTVAPGAIREGRKWMLEEDFLVCARLWRAGRLGFRAWARSVRGVRETAWFAVADPMPLVGRLRWAFRRLSPAGTPAPRWDLPDRLRGSKVR
ncbi:MAG: carboxylate--amine ligase [Armatimonadota bacterium]|nr:carboxylate--amine ligase [Armatimonadota bacterium]MDR7549008.1 carboxylate--amine ligase [Armatimonadota bacterium]